MSTIRLAAALIDMAELRAGSVITEREVFALRKRWGRFGKVARNGGVGDEMEKVQYALPMQISDEQGKKGLDYLRKLLLRKDGTLRETQLVVNENIKESHRRVIQTLDRFELTGFHEDCNDFGHTVAIYPIYKAVGSSGEWFEYVARPWVGGLPTFGQLYEELS